MKIGVLSDIHLSKDDGMLQRIVDRYLSGVDMFFLCGDFVSMEIYEMFLHKKVAAVSGNMDDPNVKKNLPFRTVVEIDGFLFGLMHGWGSSDKIEDRILKEFHDVDGIDCIVYGHTHYPVNKEVNGVRFFNPGSPTDKRFAPFNSVGIINTSDNKITGEIIRI